MRSEDGNGGMDNGDIEGGGDDQFHAPRGRKYSPVVDDDDRAVLEMSSMDPSGSSSSSLPVHQASLKYFSRLLSISISNFLLRKYACTFCMLRCLGFWISIMCSRNVCLLSYSFCLFSEKICGEWKRYLFFFLLSCFIFWKRWLDWSKLISCIWLE